MIFTLKDEEVSIMGRIINRTYYTYKDVTIEPCVIRDIEHREECNPYYEDGFLPLFTAPMDTVISKNNFSLFKENKINAILPRTETLEDRVNYSTSGNWAAFSLKEFEDLFCGKENKKFDVTVPIKVLIDVANGHMKKITELVSIAKEVYGNNIIIMAGNIANPQAYYAYAKCGIDYVRVGIGGGKGCITSTCLGVHMPMASLINDISIIKDGLDPTYYKSIPKIVADGGIRGYADIMKSLALGADYVMIGSVFARMLESAAPKYSDLLSGEIDRGNFKYMYLQDGKWMLEDEEVGNICATFYGMASRQGQIAMKGAKTKTSEGTSKCLSVDYKMDGWCKNFTDYLCSTMSYVGVRDLERFKKDSVLIINSQNAVNAVNK